MAYRSRFVMIFGTLVLFCLAACTPKSPAEKVAEIRQDYTVELNAFLPQKNLEEPVDAPLAAAVVSDEVDASSEMSASASEAAAAAEGEEGEMAEGDEMAEGEVMEETGPQPTDILFDLVVLFNGRESLPGLTVDISQVDPFEKEKGTYRQWIEPGPVVNGQTKQVSFVLEIPNYEDGDAFSVFVRSSVPPEERGDYAEFAAAQ